jgi:hypothetical protein
MSVTKHDFVPALLYASTTESLIPWDWISESRSAGLFMAERERAQTLLRAVNGDSLPVREWGRFCGAPLNNPMFRVSVEGSSLDDLRVALLDQAKNPLRAALEAVIHDPEAAIPEIGRNAAAITDGRVVRITEISEHGVLRERVIAHSIGSALIFALALVIDLGKPYRKALRQCALPACSRFALGDPPETRGQPPNFYCPKTDHRVSHRRQQASERQAARRSGVTVRTFRKRKMRSQETKQ